MVIKIDSTPDELEYTIRMLMDIASKKQRSYEDLK